MFRKVFLEILFNQVFVLFTETTAFTFSLHLCEWPQGNTWILLREVNLLQNKLMTLLGLFLRDLTWVQASPGPKPLLQVVGPLWFRSGFYLIVLIPEVF